MNFNNKRKTHSSRAELGKWRCEEIKREGDDEGERQKRWANRRTGSIIGKM